MREPRRWGYKLLGAQDRQLIHRGPRTNRSRLIRRVTALDRIKCRGSSISRLV